MSRPKARSSWRHHWPRHIILSVSSQRRRAQRRGDVYRIIARAKGLVDERLALLLSNA